MLVVATSWAVFQTHLSESFSKPAVRLDITISPYGKIDGVVGSRGELFAVIPTTEDDCPLAVFRYDTILDTWNALDGASVQFDYDGTTLVAASYGHLAVLRPECLDSERSVWRLGEPFEAQVDLIPGAMGRLASFSERLDGEDGTHTWSTPRWIDPIARKHVPLNGLELLKEETAVAWVDQGHLFSESSRGIRDHGPLTNVKPVKAGVDATALSPWSIERSADKMTLIVRSIYRGGPTYALKRVGSPWTQDASLYGLHALYDDGEVYDLRTGKLALTIEFDEAGTGDYLIRSFDGAVTGTKDLIARRELLSKLNPSHVNFVVRDVLQRRRELSR